MFALPQSSITVSDFQLNASASLQTNSGVGSNWSGSNPRSVCSPPEVVVIEETVPPPTIFTLIIHPIQCCHAQTEILIDINDCPSDLDFSQVCVITARGSRRSVKLSFKRDRGSDIIFIVSSRNRPLRYLELYRLLGLDVAQGVTVTFSRKAPIGPVTVTSITNLGNSGILRSVR